MCTITQALLELFGVHICIKTAAWALYVHMHIVINNIIVSFLIGCCMHAHSPDSVHGVNKAEPIAIFQCPAKLGVTRAAAPEERFCG